MWVLQAAVTLLPLMGLAATEWVRAEQPTTHLGTGLKARVTEQVAPGRLELELEKAWVKWSSSPSAEKQTGGKAGGKAVKVQTERKKNQH